MLSKKTYKTIAGDSKRIGEFIGCCLLMSIFNLPRSRMFWGKKTSVEAVANVMSRERWEQIKTNLHFNNNNMPSQLTQIEIDFLNSGL